MSTRRTSVKLSDVAAAAGVAPMTVSRFVNSPERVAPETAARVRAAIERLGYVPNLIAGGLASQRSRIVAAVVPTIASPMFSASVQAFTDVLNRAGYHTVLGLTGYGGDSEDALVGAILGRRPDGMLLTGAAHSAATRRRLATAGIPVVEIWDLADDPADMIVGFDHRAVGAAVAAFFLARGYHRFGAITATDPRATARRAGYAAALPPGTLVFDHRLPAPASIQGRRDALAGLPGGDAPIAVFCSSDFPAAGAVIEAGVRGIAVPSRLAVCGFGDFEIARTLHPAITTVSVDGAEIGRAAAEALLHRLAGQTPPRSIAVPFRIIERASTGQGRTIHC